VRAGEAVLVTDRGEVVAEITPPGHAMAGTGVPHGLRALSKRGLVTVGQAPTAGLYPAFRRTRRRHTGSELLDEERGQR
jgi:antitoxin (DNA-binding transcriptional repressor) of toxin-antitoxin stability system